MARRVDTPAQIAVHGMALTDHFSSGHDPRLQDNTGAASLWDSPSNRETRGSPKLPAHQAHAIRTFTTRPLPESDRFDFWMSVLANSLWQVTGWTDVAPGFNVDVQEASLGSLSTIQETISPHRARRSTLDVERSQERNFHLFVSDGPSWAFAHCGREERMNRGDVVMMAEGEHETIVDNGFHGLIIKCPESWMQTWLPDPGCLVGRSIAHDSRWGRVLSPLVAQLTPEFVSDAPLPQAVIADQLGAVLTMVANDGEARAAIELPRRVRAAIRERCTEPALTANDVASTLGIEPRALHRALAAEHTTFANELLAARVDAARPLLTSHAGRQLSVAEVAARAGFRDERHFARTVRRRTGHTPLQLRRTT